MLQMGIRQEIIVTRMLQLNAVPMRLELIQGINNCSIINDSYSADLSSFRIALDFLVQQQQHAKRTVILSDILFFPIMKCLTFRFCASHMPTPAF
jgi:alanine racemase